MPPTACTPSQYAARPAGGLIRRFGQSGHAALDPMAGSDTALVEACLLGRNGLGRGNRPLARLISKAKATPVDLDIFDKTVAEASRLLTGTPTR